MIIKEKVKELRDKKIPLYSISRLNAFDTCQYSYYKTYVQEPKDRGRPNIYSMMGNKLHDALESIYNGEKDESCLKLVIEDGLMEADILGFDFPNQKIADSWIADIKHFAETYKKMDIELKTEEEILFEVEQGLWIYGFSDATFYDGEYADVFDWKTSSEFKGEKLHHAGRQLVVYALAKQSEGYIPRKVAWMMLKYMYVDFVQKNKKVKRTLCNRGKWVAKMEKPIKNQFPDSYDNFEIDMMVDKAISENSISGLPQVVQDAFTMHDCIIEYELTEEAIAETKQYIVDTVNAINAKNANDESDWSPVIIDKSTSFYCGQLCNHSHKCPYYKKYLSEMVE